MKDYNLISPSIQTMLEDAVSSDPYGLKPESFYKTIVGSIQGTPADKVSEIMGISYSLVLMIAEENGFEID